MPDLTVPPGVWTKLPDGGAVLNESGANAVVTIEGGEIRFSAPMRLRQAVVAPQSRVHPLGALGLSALAVGVVAGVFVDWRWAIVGVAALVVCAAIGASQGARRG